MVSWELSVRVRGRADGNGLSITGLPATDRYLVTDHVDTRERQEDGEPDRHGPEREDM